MASPGELVRTLAEVLGVPEPTVTVHDRNLVTAGLRTKGGRGRRAASFTVTLAASGRKVPALSCPSISTRKASASRFVANCRRSRLPLASVKSTRSDEANASIAKS